MKTDGIRILDTKDGFVSVFLSDILDEIEGAPFFWSILFFDGMGSLQNWDSLDSFEEEVNNSERGLFIDWKELKNMAGQFDEIIDILIIGNNNCSALKRYEDSEMMYRSCDFVINKFDSSYWEIFSNDHLFIQRLLKKFQKIEFLQPDFLK